ncbi:MAG: LTA synthase family protein [Deltaproteobacteria bacterium]|nr:LTA synthase family protein [Deltaproteobacteria bacterium]MBW2361439.1 LTA synthase family protein [Deltaproteobacteria bacterium]
MGHGPSESGALRATAAFGSCLLAPWAFRALAIFDSPAAPAAANLRGFCADAALALLALGCLWPLARLARGLPVVVIGVLVIGYYANYETVTTLGTLASPLDLEFFSDPTFVRGSALAAARPGWLAVVLAGTLALGWLGLRRAGWSDAFAALAAGGFLLGALSFWEPEPRHAAWRQDNPIAFNVDWLARRDAGDAGGFDNPALAMRTLVPGIAADLDAPLRGEFHGQGKNVLLVILESVSGNYLPTAAARHGREAVNKLPALDRAFAENVGYATFFTHTRRTNRGLFALLCGEYPRLIAGIPKMAVTAATPWRRCLPGVLRDHGYRTVYLQGAPLAFMQKDRFMPAIGFDESLGHDWFVHPHLRSFWGVDDRTLLEQTFRKIDELEASGDEPWFMTLLTVGTHHPYVVPDSYESPYKTPIRRVFSYMDGALHRFLRELERRGLRDDTLVLITSDESRGDLGQAADTTAGILSENWGFLAALLPERTQLSIDEPYAQSDVPLSVLDYLGLPHEGLDFFGRSLFRRYERGRSIFYANVNYRMIGGLQPDGTLVQCEKEGQRCARYRPEAGRIFAPTLRRVRDDPQMADSVREMALRSLPPQSNAPLTFPLLARPDFPVKGRNWQMVQGVSQLSLEPNEWIEIEFEVKTRGDADVELEHWMRFAGDKHLIHFQTLIESGQTLHVRYEVASDVPFSQATIRTLVRAVGGDEAELLFRKRRFELHRSGERPPQGVQLAELRLDPPRADGSKLVPEITPIAQHAAYLEQRNRKGMSGDDRQEK